MKRILVVDDSRVVRKMIVAVLSRNNSVESVGTVKDALERIDEIEFDLIISDYNMPDADGIDFYWTLSERRSALRYRFLFITAERDCERFREFLSQTGTRCLAKPFSVPDLLETCNSMVDTPSWGSEGGKRGG